MSCGVGRRRSSDPALLWCRPAAEAPIQPLAWEPPYAMGVALKKKKKDRGQAGSKSKEHIFSVLQRSIYYRAGSALPKLQSSAYPLQECHMLISVFFLLLFFFFYFVFLGPHPQHMEVLRLGVKSELQLAAYASATAMPDPNPV